MLTKKRKRGSTKLKPPELPLELWVLIADQIKNAQDWLNLVLTLPLLGLYTLNKDVQTKSKKQFTQRSLHVRKDRFRIIYTLPDGQKFRSGNSPTVICYHTNISGRDWYEDGWYDIRKGLSYLTYRKNGSAVIQYADYGKIWKTVWYKNGKKHRDGAPAVISYYMNGKKHKEKWYCNGQLHSVNDRPAVVIHSRLYDSELTMIWYKHGKRHRTNGKYALYIHDENIYDQDTLEKAWYKNGNLHRSNNKPARKTYYCDNERWIKEEQEWHQSK